MWWCYGKGVVSIFFMHKIYLASDFHLGVDATTSSLEREKTLVRWLEWASADASDIYLVGDLFDFWFEYKYTVPKGFVRFLGKLAELKDKGINIEVFTGNHDMWMFGYLTDELDIPIHKNPVERVFFGKNYFIGHGDGLGPGDHGYKFIKKVFANKICQWLFARLHPNFSFGIANYWSGKSRVSNQSPDHFLGENQEWLVLFCEDILKTKHFDGFIFGHRHLPINYNLYTSGSKYINLGDWVRYNTYAVIDKSGIELKSFEKQVNIFTNPI